MEIIQKKIKKSLKIISIIVGLAICLKNVDASISSNLPKSTIKDTFPTSYQSYINKLKKIYPNAIFKAVYTGLNWNTVLKHESYDVNKRISTVHSNNSSVWKMNGKNNYIDGPYVTASKTAVAYMLDPRNSLYEEYIFQFEGLSYNSKITTSVIEKIIAGSPMVGTYAKQYKKSGKWISMDKSYSEIINQVGKELGVSSVYIASRMIQETGGDIVNNGSIYGSNTTYPGVYNFFNIGATPNADGSGAVLNGLKYAKSSGWTTPYLSIYGGVDEIKSSYIKYGQDTVYFQKFDVNNPYGNAQALMAYQYQTNILAPINESLISHNGYKKLDMLDTSFAFYIPVYNNMPEDPAPYPALDSAKFVADNTKVYLDDEIRNGTDVFNVRSSASSELDNVIFTLSEAKEGASNRTIMTRTKKGSGFNWDYVEFTLGGKTIKGYVWNEYVQEYDYTKVTGITLDKKSLSLEIDDTYTLQAVITPTNAKYKNVEWSVANSGIVSVENGKVIAKAVGTTTVTVKSVDQEKIDTCTITVTPKTEKISLDKSTYTVLLNNYITPQVTIKNATEYTLQIADDTKAKIVDGKIQGLKLGETILKATIKGTSIVAEAKIIVVDKMPEEYTIHSGINIKDKILTKITPGMTVNNILGKITLVNLTTKIKNIDGKALVGTDKIGTGTEICLLKEDNTIFDILTIKIYGDVNGDSSISSKDYIAIKNHIMGTKVITGIKGLAADANKDATISSKDYIAIKNHIMNTKTISQ